MWKPNFAQQRVKVTCLHILIFGILDVSLIYYEQNVGISCTILTCSPLLREWNFDLSLSFSGHAVAQLIEALRYKPEGCRFYSRHWNSSSSNRNEYQECFLWSEGWQPYHLQVPIVLKSRSHKLVESSGSVTACNGTVLLSFSRLSRLYQLMTRPIVTRDSPYHNIVVK